MEEFWQKASHLLQDGQDLALVYILESTGSTPRETGAVMAIYEQGEPFGTIGGGLVELTAQKDAKELLQTKQSKLKTYSLTREGAASLGMVCGGDVLLYLQYVPANEETVSIFQEISQKCTGLELFWLLLNIDKNEQATMKIMSADQTINEPILNNVKNKLLQDNPFYVTEENQSCYALPLRSQGKIFIFGAGHVAQALVPVLDSVSFSCIVVDEREQFANESFFPNAYAVYAQKADIFFKEHTIKPEDYIAIMTRGHMFDLTVLKQALKTPAHYIGLIGSKTKLSYCFTELIKEDGYTYSDLEKIYAPIGLQTGGKTPAEIAISIAAEILQVKYHIHPKSK